MKSELTPKEVVMILSDMAKDASGTEKAALTQAVKILGRFDVERKRRQAEGIAIAKEQGKYTGRKPIEVDTDKFVKLYTEVKKKEHTATFAMNELGVKNNTWYRLCQEYESRTGRFEL